MAFLIRNKEVQTNESKSEQIDDFQFNEKWLWNTDARSPT
ncbi:hypothetical protein FLBR109950_00965 [Flavobacterium branchiophilum]